eukprot:3795081-Pyramimonas_sp.AAC.1
MLPDLQARGTDVRQREPFRVTMAGINSSTKPVQVVPPTRRRRDGTTHRPNIPSLRAGMGHGPTSDAHQHRVMKRLTIRLVNVGLLKQVLQLPPSSGRWLSGGSTTKALGGRGGGSTRSSSGGSPPSGGRQRR